MVITVKRTNKNRLHTLGVVDVDSTEIGYSLEPPCIDQINDNRKPCLQEGEYIIELRNNPIAGTPSIKVRGTYVSASMSIRSCISANEANQSITIIDSLEHNGCAKNVHPLAWAKLLMFVAEAIERGEEVKLVIK